MQPQPDGKRRYVLPPGVAGNRSDGVQLAAANDFCRFAAVLVREPGFPFAQLPSELVDHEIERGVEVGV